MSYPAEGVESAYKNNIDEVREFLESNHSKTYAVYNCSMRPYRPVKFENRVSDCGWPTKRAPSLQLLFSLCQNMHLYLRQNNKNICIVHCEDGKSSSATLSCAFLCYCKLFDKAESAINLFIVKRKSTTQMTASQIRYVNYICELSREIPRIPHLNPIMITSISMTPVPLFTRLKNGCRPFVEVFCGENRILSTSQEYDKMSAFSQQDISCKLPLNALVMGDVTISIYHARSTLGGKVQGKITSMKMLQLQFHTGFIAKNENRIMFPIGECDLYDTADKFPSGFRVSIDVNVSSANQSQYSNKDSVSFDIANPNPSAKILFKSRREMQTLISKFECSDFVKRKLSNSDSTSSSATISEPSSPLHCRSIDLQDDPYTAALRRQKQSSRPAYHDKENANNTQQISSAKVAPVEKEQDFFSSLDWKNNPNNAQTTAYTVTTKQSAESIPNIDLLNLDSNEYSQEKVADSFFDELKSTEKFDNQGIGNLLGDSFEAFTNNPTMPVTQSNTTKPNEYINDFDLFVTGSNTSEPALQPDLMSDWDLSDKNLNRNASNNDLLNLPLLTSQSSGTIPRNQSVPKSFETTKPTDLFADLGNLSSFKQSPKSTNNNSTSMSQCQKTNKPMNAARASPLHKPTPNYDPNSFNRSEIPKIFKSTATGRESIIHGPTDRGVHRPNGPRPKLSEDAFDDLLGGHSFKSTRKEEIKTIKQMRATQCKVTDPNVILVNEWLEGKEHNIRALLCSLHTVLWSEEKRWSPPGMHQLLTAKDVRKSYMKAVLSIHPDKLAGSPYEELARLIFIELSEAWSEFEESGMKSLY